MKYASLQIIHDMLVRADQLALEEYRDINERTQQLEKEIYNSRTNVERMMQLDSEIQQSEKEKEAAYSRKNAIRSALEDFESFDWR